MQNNMSEILILVLVTVTFLTPTTASAGKFTYQTSHKDCLNNYWCVATSDKNKTLGSLTQKSSIMNCNWKTFVALNKLNPKKVTKKTRAKVNHMYRCKPKSAEVKKAKCNAKCQATLKKYRTRN